MNSYIVPKIAPIAAPLFAAWYRNCQDNHIETSSYITAAVRYYIATEKFLSIGTVCDTYQRSQSKIGIYVRKTDDIIEWIEELKSHHIKKVKMFTYILEKSVNSGKSFSVPDIIELELMVKQISKHNLITYVKEEVPTEEERKKINNEPMVKSTEPETVESIPKKKNTPGDDKSINIMDIAGFSGLT